jgi:hypothetical protein
MAIRDTVKAENLVECENCNGDGQICPTCPESVQNCECTETGEQWIDCPCCNGEGVVEDEGIEDY